MKMAVLCMCQSLFSHSPLVPHCLSLSGCVDGDTILLIWVCLRETYCWKGHNSIKGISSSPILIPIKSLCVTSRLLGFASYKLFCLDDCRYVVVCICVPRCKCWFGSRIAQLSCCIPSVRRHCCCCVDPSSAFYVWFSVQTDYIAFLANREIFVFETLIKCIF